MTQQFTWKDAAVVFDNEEFQVGFERGRDLFFHGSDHKQETSGTVILKASELLRIMVLPDTGGRFHLDNETDIDDDLELIVGTLIGYMSAVSCPETPEEAQEWEKLPDIDMYSPTQDEQISA